MVMKKLALIISAILLLAVAMWMSKDFYRGQSDKPDYRATAGELLLAFAADEQEATRKYAGKRIEVTGILSAFRKENDRFEIALKDTEERRILANGIWEPGHGVPVTGDTIVLKGTCSGMLLDVIFDDCIILRP